MTRGFDNEDDKKLFYSIYTFQLLKVQIEWKEALSLAIHHEWKGKEWSKGKGKFGLLAETFNIEYEGNDKEKEKDRKQIISLYSSSLLALLLDRRPLRLTSLKYRKF